MGIASFRRRVGCAPRRSGQLAAQIKRPRASRRSSILRTAAEGVAVNPPSALTRRSVISHHGIVNSAPARRCVWPVLAPAEAFVRAYHLAWRRGSLAMSCVRSRLLFAACAPNRSACDVSRSCSARVGIAARAFSQLCMVIGLGRFTLGLCVSCRRFRRSYEETRSYGVGGAAKCAFTQSHRLCCAFRGEYVGGCAPPNLRQRVFDSLDSLHVIRGKVRFTR